MKDLLRSGLNAVFGGWNRWSMISEDSALNVGPEVQQKAIQIILIDVFQFDREYVEKF